jgi:hypothetical protein
MKVHELKCWPPYFGDVLRGDKTFEFRRDDRHYSPGDVLVLREWFPKRRKHLSGRKVTVDVVYTVLGGQFGIPEGYCIMGIRRRATDGVEPNTAQQLKAEIRAIVAAFLHGWDSPVRDHVLIRNSIERLRELSAV